MADKAKIMAGLQVIVTDLAQRADGHELQSRIFASQGFSKLADKYSEHAYSLNNHQKVGRLFHESPGFLSAKLCIIV